MTMPNLTQHIRRAKFDMKKYLQINGDHAFTNRNLNSKDTFENKSQRLKNIIIPDDEHDRNSTMQCETEPLMGIEPMTARLLSGCSTN